MSPEPSTVSVIVPAFNAERFLDEALASVWGQTRPPDQVILVDDGSTDGTSAILERAAGDPRVSLIRQANAGPAAARNRGLDVASGNRIAFLDADDLWPPDKLAIQVERLERDPELDVVSGRIRYEALDGRSLDGYRFEPGSALMTNVNLGSAVFRRSAFDRVGTFDEDLRFSEDHDWFLRAREAGLRILVLDAETLVYRLHRANMTRDRSMADVSMAEVLRRSLQRRRRDGAGPRDLDPWSANDERRDP